MTKLLLNDSGGPIDGQFINAGFLGYTYQSVVNESHLNLLSGLAMRHG